jgi:diaminopimelate epimerase
MEIEFYKYQGTGNDFVMIDNRKDIFSKENIELIAHLCDRRFGIGGDGLILLEMILMPILKWFTITLMGSTMCGNGGRCLVVSPKAAAY